jgi:ribosomal protein L44E
MTGRKPERYWRNYGDDPLPAGAEAMDEPFAAFPSWLRITCDRCGKDRTLRSTSRSGRLD